LSCNADDGAAPGFRRPGIGRRRDPSLIAAGGHQPGSAVETGGRSLRSRRPCLCSRAPARLRNQLPIATFLAGPFAISEESVMPTPVEAALLQIIRAYALIAPELPPERVRAELEPYLDGLFYDGEEDVRALAVAGLARLRRMHQPA